MTTSSLAPPHIGTGESYAWFYTIYGCIFFLGGGGFLIGLALVTYGVLRPRVVLFLLGVAMAPLLSLIRGVYASEDGLVIRNLLLSRGPDPVGFGDDRQVHPEHRRDRPRQLDLAHAVAAVPARGWERRRAQGSGVG